MFVKICANTNLEDALLAAHMGADAVGFVFAPSKRQVTTQQVAAITHALPAGVERVGVFASVKADELIHAVRHAGLTSVQMHGAFDGEMVQQLAAEFGPRLKIIQSVAYAVDAADRSQEDARFEATLVEAFNAPEVWAVLIDAAKSNVSGGLGVAFDWAHAAGILERSVLRAKSPQPRPRIIVAGGLNAANVAQAVAAMRPWGVDVASGTESSPGRKDPARLREFVAAARALPISEQRSCRVRYQGVR